MRSLLGVVIKFEEHSAAVSGQSRAERLSEAIHVASKKSWTCSDSETLPNLCLRVEALVVGSRCQVKW